MPTLQKHHDQNFFKRELEWRVLQAIDGYSKNFEQIGSKLSIVLIGQKTRRKWFRSKSFFFAVEKMSKNCLITINRHWKRLSIKKGKAIVIIKLNWQIVEQFVSAKFLST